VSDSGAVQPRETRFALAAPPPVRSLAISAGAAVIAAVVIVLGGALDLPEAVTVAGVALLIFAVVLAVVALVLTARLRTTLVLDSESITIIKGRRRRVVSWSMIDIVRQKGPRLSLITKPEGGADPTVLNPGTATDATFDALIAEIGRRMDADRGYGRRVL
jgi:hypothetical protein